MPNLNKIKNAIFRQKSELRKRFNVSQIGIFGSYVRKEQKKKSDLEVSGTSRSLRTKRRPHDLDVLVEFEEPIGLFQFMDLEEYLSRLAGVKVDLVSKKALKPRIGKHILEEVIYV